MSAPNGRSVRLFLVDGSQAGIVTAEIMNWTGHAVLAPRGDIGRVRRRPESQKTGIYFLIGEVATSSEKRPVYIGESDEVGRRIEQHAVSKDADFFERFCFFTSKDANLTKAHARYLEHRLSSEAQASERATLLNSNQPPAGSLPESDVADMEFFISQIELIMPVLGFDFLKKRPSTDSYEGDKAGQTSSLIGTQLRQGKGGEQGAETAIRLRLIDPKTKIDATALLSGSEYLVLKGSVARTKVGPSLANQAGGYRALRDALISDGSLATVQSDPELLVFTRDVAFSSPSAASVVILGRSDNGRTSWKIGDSQETLAQLQHRQATGSTI